MYTLIPFYFGFWSFSSFLLHTRFQKIFRCSIFGYGYKSLYIFFYKKNMHTWNDWRKLFNLLHKVMFNNMFMFKYRKMYKENKSL